MKQLYVFAIAVLFTSAAALAQQKARTGVYAGPAFSTLYSASQGLSNNTKLKTGWNVGILWDIPLNSKLSLHTGLRFIQKGGMEKIGDYKTTVTINDLEVPVNLVYYTNGFKGSFFFGTGLTMAMALSGKYTEKDNGDKFSESLDFGMEEDDDLKSFDFGVNFIAGYEWKNGILAGININHGFANLANLSDDITRTKYIGLKLGYMLRRR